MENKKKRRGMLAVLLGLVLTVCGGALTLTVGGRLEYILPALLIYLYFQNDILEGVQLTELK